MGRPPWACASIGVASRVRAVSRRRAVWRMWWGWGLGAGGWGATAICLALGSLDTGDPGKCPLTPAPSPQPRPSQPHRPHLNEVILRRPEHQERERALDPEHPGAGAGEAGDGAGGEADGDEQG